MIIRIKRYGYKNGEMKILSSNKVEGTKTKIHKHICTWYRRNPYAKKLNDKWICKDYRIDQQRPQRNVYSEAYIEIVQMSEMEKIYLDNLIESIEKDIIYPTVYDDGKNRYYEETIYCPKCGKRRKVLTSKTHCEECGFEFSKAKKCPKCNALNLKGSNHCIKCDYEFKNESFINNDDFEVEKDDDIEVIKCPVCNENKSKYYDKCLKCGFDYSDKKQCPICKKWVNKNDKYCVNCGEKLKVVIKCSKCGELINKENNYCNYCGEEI